MRWKVSQELIPDPFLSALNPELDIASQGPTPEQALANPREAVGLFLECASPAEIEGRLSGEAWITQFEAEYAQA